MFRRSRYLGISLYFLIWLGIPEGVSGQQTAQDFYPSLEYQIKASLLYNFLNFIQWPPKNSQDHETTFHLCILGRNRFGRALKPLEQEIVQGRKIELAYFEEAKLDEIKNCDVLFFSKNGNPQASTLSQLGGFSILTIGETQDFLDQGGMISLLIEDEKVVFDINRRAALDARLDISSKLLRIARRVRE